MTKATKQVLRFMRDYLGPRYRRKLGAVLIAIDIAVAAIMHLSGRTLLTLNKSDNASEGNLVATEIHLHSVNAIPVCIIGICGLFLLLWPLKGSVKGPESAP